jgi:hypothetical protein
MLTRKQEPIVKPATSTGSMLPVPSMLRALPELLSRIEYRSADQFTEATLNGAVIHVGNFATLKQIAQVLLRCSCAKT